MNKVLSTVSIHSFPLILFSLSHAYFLSLYPCLSLCEALFLLLPVLELSFTFAQLAPKLSLSPLSHFPWVPEKLLSFMSKHLFTFSLLFFSKTVLLLYLSYSVVGIKITSTLTLSLWFSSWKAYYPINCISLFRSILPLPLPCRVLFQHLSSWTASPTCPLDCDFNIHANYHLCSDLSVPCHTFIWAPYSYTPAWSHSSLAPHRSQPR